MAINDVIFDQGGTVWNVGGSRYTGTDTEKVVAAVADAHLAGGGTVQVPAGAWTIDDAIVVDDDVQLQFAAGARFTFTSSGSVDFGQDPIAGDHRIFDVSVTGSAVHGIVHGRAVWFGARGDFSPPADGTSPQPSDPSPDDTIALQKALAACARLELQASRKYRVKATLDCADKVLVANGAEIHLFINDLDPMVHTLRYPIISAVGAVGSYAAITSGAALGSDRFVSSALVAAGVQKDDVILLRSAEQIWGARHGEMARVKSVVPSTNTIYLQEGLRWGYTTSPEAATVAAVRFETVGPLKLVHYPTIDSEGIQTYYSAR